MQLSFCLVVYSLSDWSIPNADYVCVTPQKKLEINILQPAIRNISELENFFKFCNFLESKYSFFWGERIYLVYNSSTALVKQAVFIPAVF